MKRRYELGDRVDLPVEAAPRRYSDVVPTVRWADDRSQLLVGLRPYDPEAEKPPVEVRIYAIPEGSTHWGAPADVIVADADLSFSAVEVPEVPTGVEDFPVMLPTYPEGERHIGQTIYVYDDPDPDPDDDPPPAS